jgi:hypothetical protein
MKTLAHNVALVYLPGILFGSGFLIYGLQVFGWLRNGEWDALSLLVPVGVLIQVIAPAYLAWLSDPQSWHGLHKLVMGALDFPLALILVVAGFLTFILAFEHDERRWRAATPRCTCGKDARAGDVCRDGERSWMSCRRCLGRISDASLT